MKKHIYFFYWLGKIILTIPEVIGAFMMISYYYLKLIQNQTPPKELFQTGGILFIVFLAFNIFYMLSVDIWISDREREERYQTVGTKKPSKEETESGEKIYKITVFFLKLFFITAIIALPLCIILLIAGHLIEEPRITLLLVGETFLVLAVSAFIIHTIFDFCKTQNSMFSKKTKGVKE